MNEIKISGHRYQVIDKSVAPPRLVCELFICADVKIDRDGKFQKANIRKINHIAKGEAFASDIKDFLRYSNFKIYSDIQREIERVFPIPTVNNSTN